MKSTQKGFTLVELIVVITILAILGTIAFISLQGYSQDARNSKVTSDVRSLASAVEVRVTEGSSLTGLVTTVPGNAVTLAGDGTDSYAGGTQTFNTADAGTTYAAGNIDFVALGQSSADFGASTYKIGALLDTDSNGKTQRMYQVVGKSGPTDAHTAVVKGNYIFDAATDTVDGLVSQASATDGLKDGDTIANTGL